MNRFTHLIEFFRLEEPNVQIVFAGVFLLAALSGLVGSFTFLRKQSLIGDVIAHSILPGICISFLFAHEKDPLFLLIGAVASGWLSTYFVDRISSGSKLKEDTVIALVLSVFFGFGILLLTMIQQGGYGSQSGLDQFIFGRAASMTRTDVLILVLAFLLISSTVIVLFRGLTMLVFDPDYAGSSGFPIRILRSVLSSATVLTVALGVQAVGVVLMSALLIAPPAAARFWTNDLRKIVLLSMAFSVISALMGSASSYTSTGLPTGPWIVMFLTFFALGSAFLGRKHGVMRRLIRRRQNAWKILSENILKSFYYLSDGFTTQAGYSVAMVSKNTGINQLKVRFGLLLLKRSGSMNRSQGGWFPSSDGKIEALRIVRKHRLWELYLSRFMHLKPDHVHEDAEGIEHIITPEIESELLAELGFPSTDPHDNEIPEITEMP
ncbi:MAG: metal ABC transporter permease [Flavobacteriales bacterium]|nr:metal ABC transporter permease [Flavobacteriales bacterium]